MSEATTTMPPKIMLDRAEALAFNHYKNDRLQMAASVLERILKYLPERDDLWTLMGVIERRRDNFRDSVICLRKALEIDNENVNAAINLAEVLVSMGQVPTGVELLQGIFEEGRDPDLAPSEQNEYVIRAGAQLEFIKDTLDALRNNPEVREALTK
jgi:tetratricopeptide (TPR) repeat protein